VNREVVAEVSTEPLREQSAESSTRPARGLFGPYARITTNFIHDMSTGTWAACVLVIWVLARQSVGVPAEAADALAAASLTVFWLLLVSLVGLTVTGILRLYYWRADTSPELLKAKRSALIVKHIAFLVIYGAGTVWAWSMVGR
jgi:uncharacterized membrane protein YGL010W